MASSANTGQSRRLRRIAGITGRKGNDEKTNFLGLLAMLPVAWRAPKPDPLMGKFPPGSAELYVRIEAANRQRAGLINSRGMMIQGFDRASYPTLKSNP